MENLDGANFRLTNSTSSPVDLDYDIFGLHKKRTIIKGELLFVEYYKNYDDVTKVYTDIVVKESRTYIRDGIGIATSRAMVIDWYMTDDTVGATKNTTKYYQAIEGIDEGIVRRDNIVGDAKLYVLSQVGLTDGQDFMNSVPTEISLYINGSTQPLKDAIQASAKPYMTQLIKDTTVAILTY